MKHALSSLSVYGATLSQVCNSLIEKNFKDSMTAEELGKLLLSVQVMGIEGFYLQYEDHTRLVVESEGNFTSLCKLINSLLYLANMQQLMDGETTRLSPNWHGSLLKGLSYCPSPEKHDGGGRTGDLRTDAQSLQFCDG